MRGLYKPPGLPRVNWSHPLAYGLVDLWVTNGQVPFNLTGRTGPLSNMSGTPKGGRPTSSGQGEVFNSDLRWGANTGPSGRIALMTWAAQSGNTAAYMLGYGNSAAGNYLLGLNNGGAATGLQVIARNAAGNSSSATSSNGIITNNIPFVATANISWNASDLPSLYLDGKLLSTTNTAFATSTTDTGDVASIGGIWRGSISSPYNGIILSSARWSRWLTPAEHFMLGTDPTAFLIFPKDDVLAQIVGAGGGGTTVNITGLQANTSIGSFVPTSDHSISLLGLESVTEIGSFSPESGTNVSLTGLQSNTGQGVFSPGGSTNISLTGLLAATGMGDFTPTSGTAISVTGQIVHTGIGAFGIETSISVNMVGLEAHSAIGSFVTSAVDLTGLEALTGIGAFGITIVNSPIGCTYANDNSISFVMANDFGPFSVACSDQEISLVVTSSDICQCLE